MIILHQRMYLEIFWIFALIHAQSYALPTEFQCIPDCDSQIYCNSDLLKDINLSNVLKNSKAFVDLKLRHSEAKVLENYKKFKSTNAQNYTQFLDENFENDELELCNIIDFKDRPQIIDNIEDVNYRNWIIKVNKIWLKLAGKVGEHVKMNPDRHSYLYIPNCFIKAGGFFTETYYWDSYWIIKGLLLSDMHETAKGMIENMFTLVDKYGHMLNGNRKYYLQRSQPPLLIPMVESYVMTTKDHDFIKNNLQYLQKEFDWWYTNRMIDVHKGNKIYKMARYNADSCNPRPEGFTFDYMLSSNLTTDSDKQHLFTALKSGAESGWDFSSRHIRNNGTNEGSLLHLDTQNIIFVDLNSILHKNAMLLSYWFDFYNDKANKTKYSKIGSDLLEAIEKVLWNTDVGMWLDFDIVTNKSRNYFYASNLAPLWTGSYKKNDYYIESAIHYLIKEEIITEDFLPVYYGVPASKILSGQQWDFPNCWAPLQSFVIEGLHNTGTKKGQHIAFELARIWVKTMYEGYKNTGYMYEKYSAVELGSPGTGGGYECQKGFGWTNGFCIQLFEMYGKYLKSTDFDDFIPSKVRITTNQVAPDQISTLKSTNELQSTMSNSVNSVNQSNTTILNATTETSPFSISVNETVISGESIALIKENSSDSSAPLTETHLYTYIFVALKQVFVRVKNYF